MGVDSMFYEFIIKFLADISISSLRSIVSRMENVGIKVQIDVNAIIKMEATKSLGYTIDNYNLKNYDRTGSGDYMIKFTNIYEEININCNKDLEIISINVNDL